MIRPAGLIALAFFAFGLRANAQAPSAPEVSVFSTFPVPAASKTLLFYIQRNKNANTLVYEAMLNVDGRLRDKDPVRVQWIRHTEEGQRENLNMFENSIAFGVKHKGTEDGRANMLFVASDRFPFSVSVNANGQAEARMMIDGHFARLHHVHVQAVENAWWPKVEYVDIVGTDIATSQPVKQRYYP